MKAIQTNDQSLLAKQFVPYILNAFSTAKSVHAPKLLSAYTKDPAVIEAINRLRQWNFSTPTGLKQNDDQENANPSQEDINNSVATTIFYAWQSRFFANTIENTLSRNNLPPVSYQICIGSIIHLLNTFNLTKGIGASGLNFFIVKNIHNSALARDYLILSSLREGLNMLKSPVFADAFALSSNQNDYRWGKLHRVIFRNPLAQNIPSLGGFKNLTIQLPGIPRDGGIETINAANFNALATNPADFVFTAGASLRHVIEMEPDKTISLSVFLVGKVKTLIVHFSQIY